MDNKIYIFTESNVRVFSSRVYLKDIAECTGENTKIVEQCRSLVIKEFPDKAYGKYTMSVRELTEIIWKHVKQVDVVLSGENRFILSYESRETEKKIWMIAKILMICLIIFSGSMFSIMTFHNDVDLTEIFRHIYYQVTGEVSDGFSVLEISYSVGIAAGVLFFFNHFGRFRISEDPTPVEVELCNYRQQVDQTIMEKENGEKKC